jgi:hypothetical protein
MVKEKPLSPKEDPEEIGEAPIAEGRPYGRVFKLGSWHVR